MDGEDAMRPTARHDTRFTYEDFLLFPDDGKRHEIIDGEHYATPSPNTRHQVLVGRLFLALGNFLQANSALGRVFLAPLDVIFSRYDVVEPDVLFVAADQTGILTQANVQGAPALVIEVLSDSTRTRDEQVKRRLFARGGVREYWLVDPDLDRVRIYRRAADARFARATELSAEEGGVLTTPLLPGLRLPLAELFLPT
jgi:Uma2 family endonuclease